MPNATHGDAPTFFGLVGHPIRWGLLTELARGDHHVHELTALVGQPQALVSYHLSRLRTGGLVTSRRSSLRLHGQRSALPDR